MNDLIVFIYVLHLEEGDGVDLEKEEEKCEMGEIFCVQISNAVGLIDRALVRPINTQLFTHEC